MSTVEHERYVIHIRFDCEAVERGAFCRECDRLLAEADRADFARMRELERVAAETNARHADALQDI